MTDRAAPNWKLLKTFPSTTQIATDDVESAALTGFVSVLLHFITLL